MDRLPKPVEEILDTVVGTPAFQAGCRGFESRLPLFEWIGLSGQSIFVCFW